MKKNLFFAVCVVMTMLCTVFSSCRQEEEYGLNGFNKQPEKPRVVEKIGCVPGEAGATTFSYAGVVEKITRGINFDTPVVDGRFTATTPFTSYFINTPDSVLKYTGDDLLEVIEVNKPRYVRNMSCMSSATLKRIVNNGDTFWGTTFNDGEDHALDFGLREKWICQTLKVSDPSTGGTKEFESCDNRVTDLRILGVDSIDAKRDSADYHLMYAYVTFQSTYANGAIGKFRVKLPTWKYIGGGTPEWPDGRQPVKYFYKKRWLENKTLYRIDSFMDLWVLYSDGTEADIDDQSIDLTDEVIEPEILVKEVSELTWKPEKAVSYSETADSTRARFEKKANIFVTPLVKMYAVKVNRGTQTYTLKREGRPVYVSPLGDELEFLEPTWSEKDLGWDDSSLKDLDAFERKLLTNSAVFTLNEQDIPATARIELRKAKDERIPLGPWYSPLDSEESGLRYVSEGVYESFRTKYLRFQIGDKIEKELVGKVPILINLKVSAPNDTIIIVDDFNIQDLTAQGYPVTRQIARKDTTSYGVFIVTPFSANYKTRRNKDTSTFTYTYDGKVILIDPDTKEEIEYLALTVKPEDLGGIATMTDLPEANDFERKSMTTSIKVTETHTNTFISKKAGIEYRKAIEKEELIDWKVTNQDLVYNGNGNWTSTTTVTYYWKLAGTKTESYPTGLIWNIIGEAKSQIILDKAEADYKTLIAGSETSSTSTNGNITTVTKTKPYSDDYTTLTDKYTATMQTASYKAVVGGKTIAFDFLAPTSMVVAHKDGSLVNGNRTTTKNGTEYNVWDHTGSVTATVTSPKGNQTETATDEKEVLVKQEEIIIPHNPEWGFPVGLAKDGATLVYHPGVGASQQGSFHKNLIIKYEKGFLVVTTHSYGMDGNNWNPADFTYTVNDFYYYGKKYFGRTLTTSVTVNSAVLHNSKWEPALITMDGSGWVYVGLSGYTINMSQNLAVTAGIKNFNSETTAANNPYLMWSGKVDNNKVLTIYNAKGVPVIRFK